MFLYVCPLLAVRPRNHCCHGTNSPTYASRSREFLLDPKETTYPSVPTYRKQGRGCQDAKLNYHEALWRAFVDILVLSNTNLPACSSKIFREKRYAAFSFCASSTIIHSDNVHNYAQSHSQFLVLTSTMSSPKILGRCEFTIAHQVAVTGVQMRSTSSDLGAINILLLGRSLSNILQSLP